MEVGKLDRSLNFFLNKFDFEFLECILLIKMGL